MLSLSLNTLKPTQFSLSKPKPKPNPKPPRLTVAATLIPSSPSSSPSPKQQQLYQPFRPPPSPLPAKFRGLDTNGRLEVLANRLGLWYDYAPLIPTLIQEGFTPPTIEELTGISGVEQNRLVVAAQVRDSLMASGTDSAVVGAFDLGGAELLYEIRLLSSQQRSAAASFIVSRGLDAMAAQELARAMKDFPRRRGDRGWESFDYTLPGDCLAFMYLRQSREHRNPSEQRTSALEMALDVAESDGARRTVEDELNSGGRSETAEKESGEDGARVPVVRLKIGEVAEARKVVVLPVARAGDGGKAVGDAPRECRSEGEFGVVAAEKAWERWVVLPGWEPVVGLGSGAGVALAFPDARVLPWRTNRWYKEEAILVVADRGRTAVEAGDGFYLVEEEDGSFKVERGSVLLEAGAGESLGTVVLVVRPPKDEVDDQLSDEDWE